MAMRPPSARGVKRRSVWGRLIFWVYFPALFLVAAFLILLWKSGQYLVKGGELDHAGWAFVLPGETQACEASDAALALAIDGRIDTLVLVGGRLYKTRWITELSRGYLETQGMPPNRLFEMRVDAGSDFEVARQVLAQARLQQIDTLNLITSNFHARATGYLYRKLAGGLPVIRLYAAETPVFKPSAWWATAQSREIWLREWFRLMQMGLASWTWSPDQRVAEIRNLTPDIWLQSALPKKDPELPPPKEIMVEVPADSSSVESVLDSAARILDSLRQNLPKEAVESEPPNKKAGKEPAKGKKAKK